MKRLVAVVSLIICLSFPVFAGHTIAGNVYCDCNTPDCMPDYPGECGGLYAATQGDAPKDVSSELGIAIVALLLWLRLKG